MSFFWQIIILFLLFLLQTSAVAPLSIRGVAPDLILVYILFLIISSQIKKQPSDRIWWLAFFSAVMLDFYSGLNFGLFSASFLLAVYFVELLGRRVFDNLNFWLASLLIIIGTLINDIILIILSKLFSIDFTFLNWSGWLVQISYNLAVFIVFYGAKKIFYKT